MKLIDRRAIDVDHLGRRQMVDAPFFVVTCHTRSYLLVTAF